mmetsp:Transcript_8097/g.23224  ORF Transcript_8097/g.23224 Transcript_8097/m.23224 type:complete len:370 (+) Transcript_8097:417-1526(+)
MRPILSSFSGAQPSSSTAIPAPSELEDTPLEEVPGSGTGSAGSPSTQRGTVPSAISATSVSEVSSGVSLRKRLSPVRTVTPKTSWRPADSSKVAWGAALSMALAFVASHRCTIASTSDFRWRSIVHAMYVTTLTMDFRAYATLRMKLFQYETCMAYSEAETAGLTALLACVTTRAPPRRAGSRPATLDPTSPAPCCITESARRSSPKTKRNPCDSISSGSITMAAKPVNSGLRKLLSIPRMLHRKAPVIWATLRMTAAGCHITERPHDPKPSIADHKPMPQDCSSCHIGWKGRETAATTGWNTVLRKLSAREISCMADTNSGDFPKRYVKKIDSRILVCSSSHSAMGWYMLPSKLCSILRRNGTCLYRS